MRVAVVLCGEMRGCSQEPLLNNVVLPLNADLYVHTRKDAWWEAALKLPYIHLSVAVNRPLPIIDIVGEHNPLSAGHRDGEDRRSYLYQSYMQQYHSMAVGANMLQGDYDWVVRARPDAYIKKPLDLTTLKRGHINVPWNDWWPYEELGVRQETCTDKFAVGPQQAMWLYLSKINHLKTFCRKHRLQGERFTVWHMEHLGIEWCRNEAMELVRVEDAHSRSVKP